MVDTPHWSGGNASLDSIQCGFPIVTLPGRFMRGRQTAVVLQYLGCKELIASYVKDGADIAVAVAHDETHRKALGEKIRWGWTSFMKLKGPLLAAAAALCNLVTAS